MFLFAERLQNAARPAVALLDQIEQHLRRLGVGRCRWLVIDLPPFSEQLHRHVKVFGERVAVVSADAFDGLATEDAHRPRHDVDCAPERLRIANDVQSFDVFERLQLRPDVVPVDHLHVSGDGADVWIAEVIDRVA